MDFTGGSLTLGPDLVNTALVNVQKIPLFFQVGWTDDTDSGYSYSLPWAIADSSEASQILSTYPSLVTSGMPAYTGGSSPKVTTGALPSTTVTGSSSDASSSSSTSTAATASSSAGNSGSKGEGGGKSGGLSTGAIVGIAIGAVAALVIASLAAACLCLRRRRRRGGAGGGRDGAQHAMQGMTAEKEARVGILEGDQPDTPYSERAPPGPGPSGVVGMGAGHAAPGAVAGSGGSSGAYAPASSSDGSPTHTHPSSSIHERPFAPGTAAGAIPPQQQQQQQQHDYSQHRQLADGDAARGVLPSDEHQPISPESAGGSAGGTPRMREAAFGGRSATPSGISGRYAHLVEEGMTVSITREHMFLLFYVQVMFPLISRPETLYGPGAAKAGSPGPCRAALVSF